MEEPVPIAEPKAKRSIKPLFISLLIVIVLATLAYLLIKFLPTFLTSTQLKKEGLREFRAPAAGQENPFDVNPFSEETTYENPFSTPSAGSEYQNPFEALR